MNIKIKQSFKFSNLWMFVNNIIKKNEERILITEYTILNFARKW